MVKPTETSSLSDLSRGRGAISIAPDGCPFIIGAALVTGLTACLGWSVASIIGGLLFLCLLNFFRYFQQNTPQDEGKRNYFTLKTDNGVQTYIGHIFRFMVRRIVFYVRVGDKVDAGQRVGMLRFGLRANNHFPAGFELCDPVGW